MTFTQFINKNIRKDIDYDGVYGAQCVDVFRQYAQDVLDVPRSESVNGAKDLFLNYLKMPIERTFFQRISDRKKGQWGDVAIWDKTETNPYGHIGIVLVVEDKEICVLEQNGLKQGEGCYLKWRKFDGFLGYLRKKVVK